MMILAKIKNFFSGDARSVRLKKNIVGSALIKGCSILISFFLVPLTLGYLNAYEYGIWLTLSSILMWINYFDIGLGNGLRNKLAEALATGDKDLARTYVSTAFFVLTIIICAIYLLFLGIHFWLDWYMILNVSPNIIANLNSLVSIVFLFFCFSFVLKIIGNIYLATQLPIINNLLILCGHALSFVAIYFLTKVSQGNLAKVAITYSCSPVLVYIIAYPITFLYKYPYLRPRFSAIKFKYAKDLMGLGIQFFAIQIACLIIFSSSNIVITHLFGPEYVTPYNIAFTYFSVITMVFNIIISPIWSAVTDAYVKNDYNWIQRVVRGLQYIWLALGLATLIMIVMSNVVYRLWVGVEIKIPLSLSIIMGIYVTISNWNNIYVHFLNGVGKIRLQLYYSIGMGVIYIPLAIGLGRTFGLSGIISAMCIVLLAGSILSPIQYRKIMNKNTSGIWGK
jgi:O-antigen/teichoic acid export membrane protein